MNEYRPPVQPWMFSLAFARVGRDQHRDPVVGDDVIDVLLVPVLGVSDDDRRLVGDTDLPEFVDRGLEHRSSCDQSVGLVVILRRARSAAR